MTDINTSATRTQLSRANIKALPFHRRAVYALRHTPTGHIYFGSTLDLHKRLEQWFYRITDLKAASKLPGRVAAFLNLHGREPLNWSFTVLDATVEGNSLRGVPVHKKPEWPFVTALRERAPALLLNETHDPADPAPAAPGMPGKYTPYYLRSTSPRAQLRIKYERKGRSPTMDPTPLKKHNWPVDPRNLDAGAWSPQRPFAEYLWRAMINVNSLNPSQGAIEHLYIHWRKHLPADHPIWGWPVPGTINDALKVPAPIY